MKLTREVKIDNPQGLHARPATAIARMLQGTSSQVSFQYQEQCANARSVIELLMLAAKYGAMVQIEVEGEDAPAVMERLMQAVEVELGEQRPRHHV